MHPESAVPDDATDVEDVAVSFCLLPFEVLVRIAATLMPPPNEGFAAPPSAWHDVVHFVASSLLTHAAMLEAMRESYQLLTHWTTPNSWLLQLQ